MRKRLAVITMVALLGGAMAGCMPSGKVQTTSSAETVATTQSQGQTQASQAETSKQPAGEQEATIRMNWWGGDSRHKVTLEAIEAFIKHNPNINVDAEYEAFTGHQEKIALAINSGAAADVLQMNMNWIFNYSPKGETFIDLNTVSDVLDLSAYDQADLDFFTINGSLQAVPISKTGKVFYWNKTTFDKVGVEIPTTLDELVAAGEKFAAFEDGKYYPLVILENEKMDLMIYYLQSKYGKPWIEDYKFQYSKEEIIDGLEFMKKMEDSHVLPSSEKLAGDGADLIDTNQNWIDGHYGGIYMWDSNLKKHQEALEDGVCVLGSMIDMGDYHGGFVKVSQALAIPATSQYPKEAAMLIEFLFGNEEGIKILGDSRGVPCNKKAIAALDLSESIAAQANSVVMEWDGFLMDIIYPSSSLVGTDGLYLLVLQTISYGEASVDECADMLIDGTNKVIESVQKQ